MSVRAALICLAAALMLPGCDVLRQDENYVGPVPIVPKSPTPETPLAPAPAPAADSEPAKPSVSAPKSSASFTPPDPKNPIRKFDEILALPSNEFDLAEAVLALGQEVGASGDAQATLLELDTVAARAKADLPKDPDGQDYFDSLYEVVLNRKSAEPFREDRLEDYDLTYTVAKHKGACLGVGIMTLAVARRMGAPIAGAHCPSHFFLRYVPPPDSKGRVVPVNFDVTRLTPSNWTKLDDDFYRKWQHFDEHAEAIGAYMRPLTDREVIGVFLSSRSGYFASRKNFAQALKDADRSLQLNARNITACINAGYAQESLGNLKEAKRYYGLALAIDPNSVRALNNLAYVKVKNPDSPEFDPKQAEKLIETALNMDPNRAYLMATHGEVKAALKDWRGATRCLQDAAKLEPKNAAYRERFLFFREKLRSEK